ncbi:MAG: DoxX family protein [Bacteroidetes bacterium]|nr:DoxX family protein [Bacteroidota bacterium]HET6243671.1 BT_3928 family protein [Bacteroidia bacterium]
MKYLVILSRILVGVLFIVSGLIKANDPLGFSYKLEEYFDVFGMDWMHTYALALSIFISVSEVILGVATLLGTKMKPVAWSLLGLIVFFTFLTFYSAYFNKVTDCGCFGDAVKLTPWESFSKDIILLFFITIIFIRRNKITSVFNNQIKPDYISVGITTALSLFFAFYCLWHLPVKDFRPYAIGKSIPEQMKLPVGAVPDVYETKLVYKNSNTGEVKQMLQQEYMDSKIWELPEWEWQDTQNKLVQKGDEAKIKDFKILGFDGYDYTEDILNDPGYVFMFISYDIKKSDIEAHKKFSAFAEKANSSGAYVIGLSASSENSIEELRHEAQSSFDYYSTDEITLKTIIRSNPGLVLLKQGVVVNMWHYNDIPNFEKIESEHLK